MDHQKLKYLLEKYFNNTCTQSEWQQLSYIMNDVSEKEHVQDVLAEMMEDRHGLEQEYDHEKWQHVIEEILEKDKKERITIDPKIRRFNWRWVAAASVFILLVSAVALKFFLDQAPNKNNQMANAGKVVKNDHAVLTLADGSEIILDSAKNGELGTQGNTKIIKLTQGQLVYRGHNNKGHNQYNTISTPIGVKYQLLLPDGTAVWLNAASSLRFPVVFDGNQREVSLTGEAYFEVAKQKTSPFIVHAKGTDVLVLGTHFNVMAYDDEDALKTTLLEGKVKVVAGKGSDVLLSPLQQVHYRLDEILKVRSKVDVEEVMAWKNDFFYFRDADIKTIMRQLSRWYNINVEFKGRVNHLFYAEIPHNQDLASVLKALSLTGNVHFDMKGNNITVSR